MRTYLHNWVTSHHLLLNELELCSEFLTFALGIAYFQPIP